jgi:gluconolactonase
MKKLHLPAVFLVLTILPVFSQVPIAPGAELKLVAEGFKFTEGPAADPKGDVYFTDQPNDRILKWTAATGKVEPFLQPCGRANGLCFDPDGKLIACADEKGELRRIDPDTKAVTILIGHYSGKLLNGPNDVWIHPEGGIYFTDPFYQRDYWQNREKPDQEKQRVFFLPKDAKAPVIADDTLVQPNGIVGSADGRQLFVADIGAGKTFRYRIAKDGRLTDRRLFCEMGSDGMTLDSEGNLYLTGKGVTVFDKKGNKLGEIPVPETWTANLTFGGPERKTLFITAMDSVYTLEMAVKGL